jgi:hypothetical protein
MDIQVAQAAGVQSVVQVEHQPQAQAAQAQKDKAMKAAPATIMHSVVNIPQAVAVVQAAEVPMDHHQNAV